jgi:hypothetical protein
LWAMIMRCNCLSLRRYSINFNVSVASSEASWLQDRFPEEQAKYNLPYRVRQVQREYRGGRQGDGPVRETENWIARV